MNALPGALPIYKAGAAWAVWVIALLFALLFGLTAEVRAQAAKPDFDQIFSEIEVVMLLIDPGSGRIVDANPAAAHFYGYAQDKLRSMTIQQINTFTPEQVAAERKLAASEGRNFFIFRHRLASGEIRSVEVHSRPFEFSGQKLLLSVVHDTTPGQHQEQDLSHYRQRLEEMVDIQVREIEGGRRLQRDSVLFGLLPQAGVIGWLVISIQRRRRLERERETLLLTLQARNHELSRLGEVMAHHFQEPARRLMSFSKRLQGKPALVADEDSRLAVEFINQQARRLSDLVGDAQRYLLLDHTKVGGTGENPQGTGETADSAAALHQSIAAAGAAASDADISLLAPLPRVGLAEKRLRELFAILLDNALRYRHPARPLRIEVGATVAGGRAVFRFADNGCGIAPEYRLQVFDLFTRLVPNSVPGTGVGLALVRKIVQQTGGDVSVEDGIDGGACIVFDLPLETDL
jgi:chemotaxis family two-component system sensor kinase Cph1